MDASFTLWVSIVTCYVNLRGVTLIAPGGKHGLRLVVANAVFALLSVVLVSAWVILCLYKSKTLRRPTASPLVPASPRLNDDGNCPK